MCVTTVDHFILHYYCLLQQDTGHVFVMSLSPSQVKRSFEEDV